MRPAKRRTKEESFNFRVDARLKAAFQSATRANDQPAAQVLRDFMRAYAVRRKRLDFAAEAERQSMAIAARAARADSDESAVLRAIESHIGEIADDWK